MNINELVKSFNALNPEEQTKALENLKPEKVYVSEGASNLAAAQLKVKMDEHGFTYESPSCEFRGSKTNIQVVKAAILEKYGEDEVNKYIPVKNVKPRTQWLKEEAKKGDKGMVIPENEQPLCFVDSTRQGKTIKVALFHKRQLV